jgi:hypothetical protein
MCVIGEGGCSPGLPSFLTQTLEEREPAAFFFFLDRMKASGGEMLKMSKLW